ncbi:hypothetical protein [Vibrio rarus]|uniref:hypothetical protein n=1 Tax=Vibrio rarus TaxID=413403 RepID=UPI0021C46811|nr:hypothetical protein [Vibrio rarus]
MKNASICFSEAQQAWALWNLVPYATRYQYIETATNQLPLQGVKKPLAFHHKHCAQLLSESQLMPGPTGETNELYTAGRGVALIIADRSVDLEVANAFYAQLLVALLSGNTVLVCVQDSELALQTQALIAALSLPVGVLNLIEYDQYPQLLANDIRVTAVVGELGIVQQVNRALAVKSGAICPLIMETQLSKMPVAQDPKLVLRYITERTCSTNITAVGGNATLLELGSAQH